MIPSDHDLLRGLRAGEEEAFTVLYRRWQGPVYRYALRMSGSPALAEDVTQEVFMALLRRSEGYDPSRGELSSYLHGIARNMARRRLERERSFLPLGRRRGPRTRWRISAQRERTDLVWGGLPGLPPHREAVVLCDLRGLSYEEARRCSLRGGDGALGGFTAGEAVASRLRSARTLPPPHRRRRGWCDEL